MRLLYVLVAAAIASIGTSEAVVTTNESPRDMLSMDHSTVTSLNSANLVRRLRVVKPTQDDGSDLDETESEDSTEERGLTGKLADFSKKVSAKVAEKTESALMWTKVRGWLEKGKSDDYVLGKLEMKNVAKKDWPAHPNYQYWKYFAPKAEEYRLLKFYHKDTLTYSLWTHLGLETAPTAKNLAFYKKYANMWDDKIVHWDSSGYYRLSKVNNPASEKEMSARAKVWIEHNRDDDYVIRALGLDIVKRNSPRRLPKEPDYAYFLIYKALKLNPASEAKMLERGTGWITRNRDDNYVINALGLQNVAKNDLMKQPNYAYFLIFQALKLKRAAA